MIKCNVTACGTISNSAVEKQSKEGTPFISFSITIPIAGSDGSGAELQVFVSAPGNKDTMGQYSTGRRVKVNGTLYIKKIDERTYYNLRSDGEIEIVKSTEADALTGSMEFKGKIKGEIVERTNKKRSSVPNLFWHIPRQRWRESRLAMGSLSCTYPS